MNAMLQLNYTKYAVSGLFILKCSPTTMDEGRERDNTSRKGGLPTLPGLYRSTIHEFSLRDEGSTEYMCVRGR
jgi:hypothetical protein